MSTCMAKSATLKLRDGTAKQFMTTAVTETLSTIFYSPVFFPPLFVMIYQRRWLIIPFHVLKSGQVFSLPGQGNEETRAYEYVMDKRDV